LDSQFVVLRTKLIYYIMILIYFVSLLYSQSTHQLFSQSLAQYYQIDYKKIKDQFTGLLFCIILNN